MGGSLSKLTKRGNTSQESTSEVPDEVAADILVADPRSPTEGIQRTPIVFEEQKLPQLRIKLLRNIQLGDPRSPTEGVVRTPLTACDSPTSIYSCYRSDVESVDGMEPEDPSANISGFSTLDDKLEELVRSTTPELLAGIEEVEQAVGIEKEDCEHLAKEIISNLKPRRKPLSNITSSAGNTPTRISLKKPGKINVYPIGENSPVFLNKNMRAQWDIDSTMII